MALVEFLDDGGDVGWLDMALVEFADGSPVS